MKTTSIITASSALAIAIFALVKINIGSYSNEHTTIRVKEVADKAASTVKGFSQILSYKETAALSPVAVLENTDRNQNENATRVTGTSGRNEICLDEVVFIEQEEEINLGFDVDEYLPADFDPYAKAGLDLTSIAFIESEEEVELGFDTAAWLPEGFDPFARPADVLDEIVFLKDESIELGFDTSAYLPKDFDPYAKAAPDFEVIFYIEKEEPVELGFDVNAYLPADFDPYTIPAATEASAAQQQGVDAGKPIAVNSIAGEDLISWVRF